jgi:hypothetical protein
VTDWSGVATAAVTGATAIASGAIGYLVARLQGKTETEKLREERRDAHRNERQAAYQGFLDIELGASSILMAGASLDQATFEKELSDFNHHYNSVRLLGTQHVGAAAEQLAGAYFAIFAASGLGVDEAWTESFARFKADYITQYDDFYARRRTLLESMMGDVGPETR